MPRAADIFLRLSVAFAFLYPPADALLHPDSWIGYFPAFLLNLAGTHSLLLLHGFGIIEIVIALWILLGKRPWLPAVAAACMLLGIVAFNLTQIEVVFRDVAIALAACALAAGHLTSRHV